MYLLDTTQLGKFDLNEAGKFVDLWSTYYESTISIFGTKELISYIDELNLRNELTDENIRRLLRWKDPRMLTQNPEKENEKVQRILDKRKNINDFRFFKKSEANFREDTKRIFPNGIVWRIFLFHIARPFHYPIGDQNVFEAYSKMTKKEPPTCWEEYLDYREYFFKISLSAGVIASQPTGNEDDISEIVKELKRVDNALLIFGKFLRTYGDKIHKSVEKS